MKILYYDCFSGISGDMNLGAMIDVGVDKSHLVSELEKLKINEYNIIIKQDTKNGILGTKVDIILSEKVNHHAHDVPNGLNHNHQVHNSTQHHHHHRHRNLSDVENIINSSELSPKVKKMSIEIFKKVAESESKVHNKPIQEVQFHEVGAVDSIVDIVGAAICFDYLNIDKVMASKVEVGHGFVKCAHGTMPVPAPATTEILKNIPVKSQIPFETTTPTGAAILAYFTSDFTDIKDFKIDKIGYGIGTRDNPDVPNILRIFIGESKQKDIYTNTDQVKVMECNIDDMSPEYYEHVMDLLLDKGALDVYFAPIMMKKERPAVKISVLYKSEYEDDIRDVIFVNTTTLGVRKYTVNRDMLKRDFEKVKTKYGEVAVKNCYYKGKKIRTKPEYEDCKRLARENNVSISEIKKSVILSKHD